MGVCVPGVLCQYLNFTLGEFYGQRHIYLNNLQIGML